MLVPLLTLFACGVIFTALRRGATGVSLVSNILFAHVFVGLWMLYLLVSHRWPELSPRGPPSRDRIGSGTTPPASSSASDRLCPGGRTSAP